MSLLIASNLIDGVYVCADTRLSKIIFESGKEKFKVIHDNELKIVPSKNNLIFGCVGSPALGSYLYTKIQKILSEGIFIRELREILENKKNEIGEWIHEYLVQPPVSEYTHAKCVLLIAGFDPRKKRKVTPKRLFDLSKLYEENKKREIEEIFGGRPLEKFTPEELDRLGFEMGRRQTGIKDVLMQGIRSLESGPKSEIEIPVCDQHIFALKVNASGFSFDDFEWGDTAVFGSEFSSDTLPKTFFGDLDLNMKADDEMKCLTPFLGTIRDRFGDTIGGSITNLVIKNASIFSINGEVQRMKYPDIKTKEVLYHTKIIDGKPHHFYNGLWLPLRPFTLESKEVDPILQASMVI